MFGKFCKNKFRLEIIEMKKKFKLMKSLLLVSVRAIRRENSSAL